MRCFLPSLAVFAVVQSADASIWGRCDKWDREKNGCSITSGHTCSSHLSNGPTGATFEIVLGGLPASTASTPVHLQWWAPHEAIGYDPRQKSQWYTVYKFIWAAYPKFSSNDFNGGNVRVNETGHATLRFKAPSTYYIFWPFRISYPHIHLRLCTGQNYVSSRSERIEFKLDTVRVRACGSQGTYRVERFTNIAPIPMLTSTPASTTSTVFLSTTSPGGLLQTPDTNADDSFDWDALEFSPVYQCIQDNKLYNYFLQNVNDACVDTCPQNADTQHGQCVRKSTNVVAEFDISWSLQVQCDQACWNAKTPRTRHSLRLAAADHLDITFQEIEKMVLRPGAFNSGGRRLSTPVSSATLFVSVRTDRFQTKVAGRELLKSFLPNIQDASAILGLTVQSMQVDTGAAAPTGNLQNGEANDEFAPIYNQASGGSTGGQFGTTPTDGLPTCAIIAGAIGVVVLGTIAAILIWCRRRQKRNFANDIAVAKAKHVEDNDIEDEKLGATGHDDNEKTMPSATEHVGDSNEVDKLGEGAVQTVEDDVVLDTVGETKASTPRSPKDDVADHVNRPLTPTPTMNVADNVAEDAALQKASTPRTPVGDVTDVPQENTEEPSHHQAL